MIYRYRPQRLDTRIYHDFAQQSLSRFGALTEDDNRALFSALKGIETWPPGQELIADGASADPPRLLLEGWVLHQRKLADGRRQIFDFLLPGDVLGPSSRPGNVAMYSAVAATPLILSPLPFLGEAMQRQSGALRDLVWHMIAREEAGLRDQVVRLGRQSAHERLIHLLLEFYTRLQAVGLVHDQGFHLPLSQEVLADALGLSVVHTNRVLQHLKREHLIESHGAHIVLCDLKRMRDLAAYRPSWRQAGPAQADAQANLKVPSCSSTQTVTSIPSP